MIYLTKTAADPQIEFLLRILGMVGPTDQPNKALMCTATDSMNTDNGFRLRMTLTEIDDKPAPPGISEEAWHARYNWVPGWRSLLLCGWKIVSEQEWREFFTSIESPRLASSSQAVPSGG